MNWLRSLLVGSVGHLVYLLRLSPSKQKNKRKRGREKEEESGRKRKYTWCAVLGMGLSWKSVCLASLHHRLQTNKQKQKRINQTTTKWYGSSCLSFQHSGSRAGSSKIQGLISHTESLRQTWTKDFVSKPTNQATKPYFIFQIQCFKTHLLTHRQSACAKHQVIINSNWENLFQ